VCPESHWPYDISHFDDEPTAFCYAFGGNYKSLAYYRIADLNQIKQTLSQGYPVAFGFTCFQSLWDPQVTETGYIPYPEPDERAIGGHAVLAVGYVDTDEQDMGGGLVIVRNSWGTGWGQQGYGFLPYAYFQGAHNSANEPPLADDYWTITGIDFSTLQGGLVPAAFTAAHIAHDRFYQFAERDRAALSGIF
jgi:C1A family cysteine protease